MNSLEKITKLMDQYQKELELVEKHKQKAKTLADEIRRQRGEEFNERINRLNLTVEQFDSVLKLLDKDNKAQLLDAIGMLDAAPDTAPGNADDAEAEEEDIQQEQDPADTATDNTEPEVPVFEEGDEKAS